MLGSADCKVPAKAVKEKIRVTKVGVAKEATTMGFTLEGAES